MDFINLHTHSSASDGADSPSEIVSLASRKGLVAVALTDHDTISGLDEFLAAADGCDVEAIPGVEISTVLCGKEIHIVGLFIKHNCEELLALLSNLREERSKRNSSMSDKLNAMGYDVSDEDILSVAPGESVGRPHFARVLVEKGYFKSHQEVFDRCLKRGCSAYSPRSLPQPDAVINAIHRAGGLAVWAHPIYRQPGESAFVRKMLRKLVPIGLDAIEAYYSLFSEAQTRMVIEVAASFGIQVSGGSDYHGRNQPGIELGTGSGNLEVPSSVIESLRQHLES